jgi:dipeptidyl aminopeptidase/acylaminoacyl peptidase
MKRALIMLGIILLIAVGIGGFLLYRSQQQAHAWLHPVRNPTEETPESVGLTEWEDVEFTTQDGLKLVGWFIPAENTTGPQPTVILLHGLSGNRGEMLSVAEAIVPAGYNAVLYDLRNHGDSEGEISTLGYLETEDVQAVIDELVQRDDVDAERIGLMGHSMGGIIAVRAAGRVPELKAVIAQSSFTSINDLAADFIPLLTGGSAMPFLSQMLDRLAGVPVTQVNSLSDLTSLEFPPLLYVHGDADAVVNISHSERLYEATRNTKDLYVVEGAGHSDIDQITPEEYSERIIAFFDEHLR